MNFLSHDNIAVNKPFAAVFLFLNLSLIVFSQHRDFYSSFSYGTLITDSVFKSEDNKSFNQDSEKFNMKKSPLKAVLFSLALPGAGQFYNESYWKIPVILGLSSYFGYEYFRNNKLYRENRDLYRASQTPENPAGNLNYKALREFYRNQRDDFLWYSIIVYVLNLVDAYVDAHLFDFDVSEDMVNRGNGNGKSYRLGFKLKF